MVFAITGSCCNDATCVSVCPVNCIHPTPEEEDFGLAEMLYIDPKVCIGCGACALVCPADAVAGVPGVPPLASSFGAINAQYFEDEGRRDYTPIGTDALAVPVTSSIAKDVLRVAVVGAGPSGAFAAEELCERLGAGVEVNLFERLPIPWGLARFGVAPDHQATKSVINVFERTARRPNVHLFLNVEVGRHLSHDDLKRHHHAVIYAVGASRERLLGIPGEQLSGVGSAAEFVGWYNGHPDRSGAVYDLSCDRAVVIGNGNVALDAARILLSDPDELAGTDIATHALEALRRSRISEVLLVGRRGAGQAAFTLSELVNLTEVSGLEVTRSLDDAASDELDVRLSAPARLKVEMVRGLSRSDRARGRDKRLVLRFGVSPVEFFGGSSVQGVRLERNFLAEHGGRVVASPTGEFQDLSCGLVLRSVGFMSEPLPGLPFDETTDRIPTRDGRVIAPASGSPVQGTFAVGWAKRGPSGYLGTNRLDARDTVESLVVDFFSHELPQPSGSSDQLHALVRERQPSVLTYEDWQAVDHFERESASGTARPRVKLTSLEAVLQAARAAQSTDHAW